MVNYQQRILYLTLVFLSIIFFYNSIFTTSYSFGSNYENVSVDTRVNITDAAPDIINISIEENYGATSNLTLLAGGYRTIYCNATIRDYNGWNDVNRTNATFWDDNNANQDDPLDNNTLYRNTSCVNAGNNGQYLSYWTCSFDVYYYANNGSNWKCNITTVDNSPYYSSDIDTAEIHTLYAINISDTELDYGDLAVEVTSPNKTLDVYNIGNYALNVSVRGYAIFPGDGLAMNCSLNGNITIDNQRFSVDPSTVWSAKTNLSDSSQDFNFTIPKQTNPGVMQSNSTYWQLYIPSTNNPAGVCTGTIVFEAKASD